MKQLFGFAMLALILVSPALGSSVEELQRGFMAKYDTLNLQRDQQLKRLSDGYRRVLSKLLENAQTSGDLDNAIPYRDELQAIEADGWPLKDLPAGSPPKLVENRRKYLEAKSLIIGKHATDLAQLADKMNELLKREETVLTQAGKLDEALSVRRMRESLGDDAGLKRAAELSGQLIQRRDGGSPTARRVPPELAKDAFTFGTKTYYHFQKSMSHAEALTACREVGGRMLRIDSEEEYAYFHDHSTKVGKSLWIDLQDEAKDGDWRHADNTKARFLKWQSGEPNGGENQKHVMIGHRGSWDMRDVNPDDKFHVICEW